ncbi:MAG: hypothetical protein HQK96_11340 [Nitrospirae bacterium]|nr:hypothetical protein [Nitrospirota bacterium]
MDWHKRYISETAAPYPERYIQYMESVDYKKEVSYGKLRIYDIPDDKFYQKIYSPDTLAIINELEKR